MKWDVLQTSGARYLAARGTGGPRELRAGLLVESMRVFVLRRIYMELLHG